MGGTEETFVVFMYQLRSLYMWPYGNWTLLMCINLYFSVIPPFDFFIFNPLTPKSDQHLISPYNIASESKKITRIKEMLLTKEPLDC